MAAREMLRSDLRAVYEAALEAVRGDVAVAKVLSRDAVETPVDVLCAGKAALAMLRPVAARVGDNEIRAFAVTKESDGAVPPGCDLHLAGHPIPDARSERAGRAWLRCAAQCPADRALLVLLSGGASALLACPAEGVTLAELGQTTELLLRVGADIEAINAVRKHLGGVGGGRSLALARSADIEVLVLSDVANDRLDTIASGPFCADPHRYEDALAVLRDHQIVEQVPPAVRHHLEAGARGERPETLKPHAPALARVRHRVVANLEDAQRAAVATARSLGFQTRRWPRRLDGEARAEAAALVGAARRAAPGTCLVAGGEPVVTVRGEGRGGRCQELALAAAVHLEGERGIALLAAGTDGSDGPTHAAGAWADGETLERGRAAGRDPRRDLEENDSHSFFEAEGGLLHTGPTGTNVNDLVLLATTETAP